MTVSGTKGGTLSSAGPVIYENGEPAADGQISQTASGTYKKLREWFASFVGYAPENLRRKLKIGCSSRSAGKYGRPSPRNLCNMRSTAAERSRIPSVSACIRTRPRELIRKRVSHATVFWGRAVQEWN